MRCPFPSKPLSHMFWWTATSELLSRSAFLPSGVAKMLKVLVIGGFVGGPHMDPLFGPGSVLLLAKRLARFEQAASEVEVTSGC